MNVQDTPLPTLHKRRSENAHEPSLANQLGPGLFQLDLQLRLERRTILAKRPVVNNGCRNAARRRLGQAARIRIVGKHQARPAGMVPRHTVDQRHHIGAATRYENGHPRGHKSAPLYETPSPATTWPMGTTRSPASVRSVVSASARSASTASIMPMPQLKVLSISP